MKKISGYQLKKIRRFQFAGDNEGLEIDPSPSVVA